jgi:hypothetical protein
VLTNSLSLIILAALLTSCQAAANLSTNQAATSIMQTDQKPASLKVGLPPKGKLFHGVHPGDSSGAEDIFKTKPSTLYDYEKAVKDKGVEHRPAWVYYSQEWGYPNGDRSKPMNTHSFPLCTAERISARGQTPFIRLMLRSDDTSEATKKPEDREHYFTLRNIIGEELGNKPDDKATSDRINGDLRKWGEDARRYGKPIIVEWGTEVNNETFGWNGAYNGQEEGARLFRQAFRHIVRTMEGSDPSRSNITWVFHVTPGSPSDPEWNHMSAYYPDGTKEDEEDVVDWLGVSIYGAQDEREEGCEPFSKQLQDALEGREGRGPGLISLSSLGKRKNRPIFILEMGTAWNYKGEDHECRAEKWTREAFQTLINLAGAPEQQVWGFSWWNEKFDGDKGGKVEMRAQESNGLRGVLREYLARSEIYNAPVITPLPSPKEPCRD